MKATITTTEKGHYFVTSELKRAPVGAKADFRIDLAAKGQTIKGFGGAVTDAAISVYESLNPETQEEVRSLLYSKKGLNYNLARLSLGSCDFSRKEYDYASKDDLSDFSLAPDRGIVTFLREVQKGKSLHILSSVWSPLARYKTTDEKCHGGKLRPDCYDKQAAYVCLYVNRMKEEGIAIEALTVQNEPEATQTWESCLYSEEEEARLGILIHKLLPAVKIYAWDHNRDGLVRRAKKTFLVPGAKEAFFGLAYHWYDGGDYPKLKEVHALFPDKDLLFTEGCVELLLLNHDDPSAAIGSFEGALRYAENYIQDLNNFSTGFIDWNVLLDEKGGPNHVGNFCEAPLMYGRGKLSINPSYYAIKHFSHFIDEGAVFLRLPDVSHVLSAGAVNPDGSVILIFLNKNEGKPISFVFDKVVYQCYLNSNQITTIAFRE